MSTKTSVKSVSSEAPSIYAIQQGSAYLKVGDVGDSVLTCRGLLNQKGYSCNLTSETYDSVLKSVVAKFQKDFGLTSDGLLGQSSLAVLQDNVSDTEWLVDGVVNITAGKLARMGFGKEVLKTANVTALNEVCNRYHITSKTKVRHFLAQGFVETDKGRTFTEYIYVPGKTKSEYDKKYQRYAPYCGGGFMQLTWEDNYTAFYNYMKDTLKVTDEEIKSPAEYATQHVAKNYTFESAGWYWDVFKDINTKISQWASLSADATVTKVRKRLMVGQMACKQERMHMQNQRRYLNRQNGGVPNLAHLLLLFIMILVIPISCISCQQNKRVVPISKHNDSIHAKIPNDTSLIHSDTSLEGKVFHIDNTVTIDSITHLPDTNKIFVFRDEKKIQTIIYKYNWEEYGSPTIGRDSIGKINFVDVDFDGNKDLLIYKGGFGNQGADIYDCFLWNDNKHQFKIAPSFSYILNPSIDNRQKCIYSFSRENASSYVNVKYKFQNGEFRAISTLKEKVDNGKMVYILETSQNGVLHKKILRPADLGEWKEKILTK